MKMSNFAKYAWFNVGYLVLVILWGMVVRATGSGAGCGRHWPTCNGEVVPRPENVATMIEFSHRLTSALAGLFVLVLLAWAWRQRSGDNGKLIWRGAILSFVFILIEGAIGAALVLLELVENNASVWRAGMHAIHLLNTYVLLMWVVLTAWAAIVPQVRLQMTRTAWLLVAAAVAMGVLSAAGAVTALGDTLFLSGALAEQMGEENAARHFLVQLRVIHPVMAVFVSLFLLAVGGWLHNRAHTASTQRFASAMMSIVVLQVLVGLFTIVLRAPLFMQISHLLLADLLWITLLVLIFEVAAHVRETSVQRTLQPA